MSKKRKKRPRRSERAKKRKKNGRRGKSSDSPTKDGKPFARGRRSSGKRSVSSSREYRGKVQKNPRGFAFLVVEGNREDVYVSAEDAAHLMQGDTVLFTVRRRGTRSSGNILKVLSRATKELFGCLVDSGDEYLLQTEEGDLHRLKHSIHQGQVGNFVIARIEKYPTRNHPALVTVVENLGKELTPAHDIRIACSRFGIQSDFSSAVDTAAIVCRKKAREAIENLGERQDLRDLPFVTIDGADAKDFDDAVLVIKEREGVPFTLFVAIADVALFVQPGNALDEEAYSRSTSTYFPGRCEPMLPESLSNDLCSLRPQEDKLTMTAELHFDKNGRRIGSRFYESVIRTAARLTYTEVQDVFDQKPNAKTKPLLEEIRCLRQLYRKLDGQRQERGVLDFDLPEPAMDVDENGTPTQCYRAGRFEAHKVIEEFMISANSAVAEVLRDNKVPTLYRVHEPPDPEKLDEVNHLLRGLGITEAVTEVSSRAFNRVLEMTHGLKGAATLHQTVLRLQKQANYGPEPLGHFGLALEDYTHFTSPIRRYPDVVVHRALKQLIGAAPPADKTKGASPPLDAMGQHTSHCERRSMEAERFVVRRKQCWFMKDRIGETMNGTVAGVLSKGLFVSLEKTCIEGFVPVEDLGGDYRFDEARMVLKRKNGHVYGMGEALRVRLDRVSVEDGEITLSLDSDS